MRGLPGPRHDAVGDEVRHLGRHARLPRRRGHLLRAAAGPRAGVRRGADAARGCRDRDGTHRDGDGRDLPVHAGERADRRGAGSGRRAHRAPDDPGLDGHAAAQERPRRHRDQLLRRVPAAVPGPRGPRQAAEVRPVGRCGRRRGPQQQLERRRQRRVAGFRAVHHPRRRPDPVGGRHPQDRAQGRAAARRSRSATSGRSGSVTPSGRAPPRRTASARSSAAS